MKHLQSPGDFFDWRQAFSLKYISFGVTAQLTAVHVAAVAPRKPELLTKQLNVDSTRSWRSWSCGGDWPYHYHLRVTTHGRVRVFSKRALSSCQRGILLSAEYALEPRQATRLWESSLALFTAWWEHRADSWPSLFAASIREKKHKPALLSPRILDSGEDTEFTTRTPFGSLSPSSWCFDQTGVKAPPGAVCFTGALSARVHPLASECENLKDASAGAAHCKNTPILRLPQCRGMPYVI